MSLTPENLNSARILAKRAREERRHAVIEGDFLEKLLAEVERLTKEAETGAPLVLAILSARDRWEQRAKSTEARIDRVRAELHHAQDNGHHLSPDCQGVSPGQKVSAVRAASIEAALDGKDQE